MKLQIERRYFEAMVTSFPALASLREQLRFGDKVEVAFGQLSDAELGYLKELYSQAGPDMQIRSAQILTLQRAFGDQSVRFTATDLESVLPAIARYLVSDAIRGLDVHGERDKPAIALRGDAAGLYAACE